MACDYEHAVESAGFGRFHYLHLFVCGWANAADAIEILCISFLLPTARDAIQCCREISRQCCEISPEWSIWWHSFGFEASSSVEIAAMNSHDTTD